MHAANALTTISSVCIQETHFTTTCPMDIYARHPTILPTRTWEATALSTSTPTNSPRCTPTLTCSPGTSTTKTSMRSPTPAAGPSAHTLATPTSSWQRKNSLFRSCGFRVAAVLCPGRNPDGKHLGQPIFLNECVRVCMYVCVCMCVCICVCDCEEEIG